MLAKRHLATISILIKDRKSHSQDVNRILAEFGEHIVARLGINVQRAGIKHCNAMITIVVEAKIADIHKITMALDSLYGVVARSNIMTE